jgi:hypothetical protein
MATSRMGPSASVGSSPGVRRCEKGRSKLSASLLQTAIPHALWHILSFGEWRLWLHINRNQDSRGAFGHAAVKTDMAPFGNLAMPLQFRLMNTSIRETVPGCVGSAMTVKQMGASVVLLLIRKSIEPTTKSVQIRLPQRFGQDENDEDQQVIPRCACEVEFSANSPSRCSHDVHPSPSLG